MKLIRLRHTNAAWLITIVAITFLSLSTTSVQVFAQTKKAQLDQANADQAQVTPNQPARATRLSSKTGEPVPVATSAAPVEIVRFSGSLVSTSDAAIAKWSQGFPSTKLSEQFNAQGNSLISLTEKQCVSLLSTLKLDASSTILESAPVTTLWDRGLAITLDAIQLLLVPTQDSKQQMTLRIKAVVPIDWPVAQKTALQWEIRVARGDSVIIPFRIPSKKDKVFVLIRPTVQAAPAVASAQRRVLPAASTRSSSGLTQQVTSLPRSDQVIRAQAVPRVSTPRYVIAPDAVRYVTNYQPKSAVMLQSTILMADSKKLAEISKSAEPNQAEIPTAFTASKNRVGKQKRGIVRSFSLTNLAPAQFVDALQKADKSLSILARPQIRTIVGEKAQIEIAGTAKGRARLSLSMTPRHKTAREFTVETNLQLNGPGTDDKPEFGRRVNVQALLSITQEKPVCLVVGTQKEDRSLVVIVSLVSVERSTSTRTVFANPVTPARSTSLYATRNQTEYRAFPSQAADDSRRVIAIQVAANDGVRVGDVVDVLYVTSKSGNPADPQIETLCEAAQVSEIGTTTDKQTDSISLVVPKEKVNSLLLAQSKGLLVLSVHHRANAARQPSPYLFARQVEYQAESNAPAYADVRQPVANSGKKHPKPTTGRANPSRPGQPQPVAPTYTQTTTGGELGQVLAEVRQMRVLIQQLHADIVRLRKTTEAGIRLVPNHQQPWRIDPSIQQVPSVQPPVWIPQNNQPYRPATPTSSHPPIRPSVSPPAADQVQAIPQQTAFLTKPIESWSWKESSKIQVKRGCSILLYGIDRISRVDTGKRGIIDCTAISPTKVELKGMVAGSTLMRIWTESTKTPHEIEIIVTDSGATKETTTTRQDSIRAKIEKALEEPVTLEFEDASLKDVVRSLSKTTGVNLVLDKTGLAEEGVTPNEKVSIHVSGVSLRSALKLILSGFNLGTQIDDEVLQITSSAKANGKLTVSVYPVADLVGAAAAKTEAYDDLIKLLVATIDPESWQQVGGQGSIAANPHTQAIVVRQTQRTHFQIKQLLSSLRQWKSSAMSIPRRQYPTTVSPTQLESPKRWINIEREATPARQPVSIETPVRN